MNRRSRSRGDYRPVRKQSNFDRPPEEFRPARSHRDLSPEPAASKDKKQIHFDFKIFIKEKHTSNFTFSTLDRIVKATNCQDIYVDENFKLILEQLLLSERVMVNGLPAKIVTNDAELYKIVNKKDLNYTLEFEFAYDEVSTIY